VEIVEIRGSGTESGCLRGGCARRCVWEGVVSWPAAPPRLAPRSHSSCWSCRRQDRWRGGVKWRGGGASTGDFHRPVARPPDPLGLPPLGGAGLPPASPRPVYVTNGLISARRWLLGFQHGACLNRAAPSSCQGAPRRLGGAPSAR
jgi:hypothetical protein